MADQIETLDIEIEKSKAQLKPQIEAICDVIVNDLPNFVLKQVRAAFIEDVSFAESKKDEELVELKARIAAFGQTLSSDIHQRLLSDMDAWWGDAVSIEKTGKTLEGNDQIWNILSEIKPRLTQFIQGEGLVAVDFKYATPARFIEGKYLPGMIEKYWAQLTALKALQNERIEADREARKTKQATRWDAL